MSNIYFDGKAYDVSTVFLHVELFERERDGKTVACLDSNKDEFISFEEAGSDVLKFQLLAGWNSVQPYKEMTLEEAKAQLQGDQEASKWDGYGTLD